MFNGLAALSLVLCVATCILWLWTCRHQRILSAQPIAPRATWPGGRYLLLGNDGSIHSTDLWISGIHAIGKENWRVPLYWIALFFALGGAPLVWKWTRRNSIQVGHCANCAYNLTGNLSGVCPECGKAIATAAK
jgi:hypothetical protein